MISESTTRAWVVTTKPITPSKVQFFGGLRDNVAEFYVNWRKAIPLTFSEARKISSELDAMFSLYGHKHDVLRLNDVSN